MSNRYIFSDTLAIFRSLFVTYTAIDSIHGTRLCTLPLSNFGMAESRALAYQFQPSKAFCFPKRYIVWIEGRGEEFYEGVTEPGRK